MGRLLSSQRMSGPHVSGHSQPFIRDSNAHSLISMVGWYHTLVPSRTLDTGGYLQLRTYFPNSAFPQTPADHRASSSPGPTNSLPNHQLVHPLVTLPPGEGDLGHPCSELVANPPAHSVIQQAAQAPRAQSPLLVSIRPNHTKQKERRSHTSLKGLNGGGRQTATNPLNIFKRLPQFQFPATAKDTPLPHGVTVPGVLYRMTRT